MDNRTGLRELLNECSVCGGFTSHAQFYNFSADDVMIIVSSCLRCSKSDTVKLYDKAYQDEVIASFEKGSGNA